MDFIITNIAPIVYDKALIDAKNWLKKRFESVELDYYMLYKEIIIKKIKNEFTKIT